MAQKLKSQDLMELFNEKLDQAIEKFDLNEKITITVNDKLDLIKKSKLKIEFEPLKELIKENVESFENQRIELRKIKKEHCEEIKNSTKKEIKYQLYFYGAVVTMFCLCAAFLSFGINQYHEKKYAEKEMKFYSKEAYRRNAYLKEEKLTDKYELWLEQKKSSQVKIL